MNDRPIHETKNGATTVDEIAAENLRRYIELAIEIERSLSAPRSLTEAQSGVSVSEGLVDPSTFKTNG